jgi:adenylate kinase family enzyme
MIIFLNGSINAGKSTIAKLLIKELPSTALVEIDTLREMIDWMPLHDSIPVNLENAVSVIRNFVKRGLNVVVPYPLSEKNYEYMVESLKDFNEKIFVFTLAPRLEKTITNRGSRELTDWEKTRIHQQYEKGIHNPSFGEIIDNSEKTPEETAKYILSKINEL